VNIAETAMAAAITVSVAGVSYAAFNTTAVAQTAQTTADRATCRAVDEAVAGYTALNDRVPTSIAQIQPLVRGDLSAYRIVRGLAAGPGCPA
jgi:hypothetical protein